MVRTGVDEKTDLLAEICAALSRDQPDQASALLREQYPFVPIANAGRHHTVPRMLSVFVRDGFIDGYSGARLICPAALRLISRRLPEAFPFQLNWRMDACHIAFWELAATIDHVVPVARGGADAASNLITTSMVRNSAKANFTLIELGWERHPPGDIKDWDGLLGWFVDQASIDRAILDDPYLDRWFKAAAHRP